MEHGSNGKMVFHSHINQIGIYRSANISKHMVQRLLNIKTNKNYEFIASKQS